MKRKIYDIEFKLQVVKAYFEGPDGMRLVARSFGLPTKNYIDNWIKELKKKGLIPENMAKEISKTSLKSKIEKDNHCKTIDTSARERMLEKENLRLRAENDLLKKLAELEGGLRIKR